MEDKQAVNRFYKHNLLRLFITSEIWYFIMYWILIFFDPQNTVFSEGGIKGVIINLLLTMIFINPTTFGSMWYIPMILCVYMMIPVLVIAIKKLPTAAIVLPLIIAFVSSMLIPTLNAFFSLQEMEISLSFELYVGNLFSMYFIYVIAGYYIGKGKLAGISDLALYAGAAAVFLVCCVYQYWAYSKPGNYLVAYGFVGVLIGSCLVFEILRRKAEKVLAAGKLVRHLSKIAFGIYFVHIIIMSLCCWQIESISGWKHSVQLVFLELVSFIGSVVIITLLAKIPILKKYMFMIKD